MRIAIVHFHLQTGGVTRVIQHACAALAAAGHDVVVLSGEPPQQPDAFATRVEIIPALGYEERREPLGPDSLKQAMEQAARRALAGAPDLWHVHNHCLGKNMALPGAIRRLAEAGQRLLLQPHDFAEDGRPALYQRMLVGLGVQDGAELSSQLYPLAPQVHYAVLNARDHRFLAAAGVPDQRLHRLPNAVSFAAEPNSGAGRSISQPPAAISLDHRRWLYPTRAIRRKNLGELLLWAALADPGERFATTLAPLNPPEQAVYRRWGALTQALALPVDLELAARSTNFGALLASSHALISTSVGEGFGLAFLEPWLIGRPLAGRDLPEITADFIAAGVDLGGLYRRIPVPLDWLDAAALRQRMDSALAAAANAYGRERDEDDLARAWGAALDQSGRIDFGRLDEAAQVRVLRHLCADPAARSALDVTRPPLADGPALIAANRSVIERRYMIDGYGRRLEAIYSILLDSQSAPVRDHADGQALIACFQAPERLYLLRA